MFKTYVSNVPLSTAHNYYLEYGECRRLHCRSYIRPTVPGEFVWRFWFQNSVNSTFDAGQVAYVNRSGGNWKILNAQIAASDTLQPDTFDWVPVSFDGKAGRDVAPDEMFWSDEVTFCVPKGQYLVWDWEIEGDGIPCTPDSQAPTYIDFGDGFESVDEVRRPDIFGCPMPDLFGCKRAVKKQFAFLGDSITQGCQTGLNAYAMWAGRIILAKAPEYAGWNLGLGFARGSDAATDGCWLYKAKQNDTVIVCYGVNDILRGADAEQVLASLRKIITALQKKNIRVILFNVPPFDMVPELESQRCAVNAAIPALAAEYDIPWFDFSSVLAMPAPQTHIGRYGTHPDGNGGKVTADAFLQSGIEL